MSKIIDPDVTQAPGYRDALIEMAVCINAATIAGIIQRNYADHITKKLDVVYGVYNLHNRLVGRPAGVSFPGNWEAGLFAPPQDENGFVKLSNQLAGSEFIKKLLAAEID